MTQGMSEEEVKKRLYGGFKETDKTRQEPVSIKSSKKFFLKKPVFIAGIAALVFLPIVIVAVTKPRTKVNAARTGEIEQIKGYLIQGKSYYKDGLFDEAILTWKNVLETSPDHRAALRYIQRAELRKKELKIREEETAQKLKKMLAQRKKEEKEKMLREEVRHLLKEGDRHYRGGNFSQAIAAYKKVISLSPGNSRAVKNIKRAEGKMASEKKKTEVVEKVVEKATEIPFYTVQVATYTKRVDADALVKKLGRRGYKNLSVNEVSRKSGRILYKVYVGSFNDKKKAAVEMGKIKKEKEGFKDSFIKAIK